ncbi:MAG: hypothetical protein EBU46_00325 [Nitrosomonadaceae bacterium]|nr:hypothetical protein [Nitrosomonadaceae bacterium]
MTRDAEGNVQVGDLTFKVPVTCSALGFFNGKDIRPGDHFSDDGWVYNVGQQPRKWFVPIHDSAQFDTKAAGIVWAPKLCWENVEALESLAYRAEQYQLTYHRLTWKLLLGRMAAAGRFRGHVLHDPGYIAAGSVYFDVTDRGVIWSWSTEYERDHKAGFEGYDCSYLELPLEQDLTNQWFAYEKRSTTLARRASKAQRAFKGVLLQRSRDVELKNADYYDRATPQFCCYRFGVGTPTPRNYLVGFNRSGDSVNLDLLSSLPGISELNVVAGGWTPPQPNL